MARHEKAVAQQLQVRGVDAFLPLQVAERRWGTRRAVVELPLFSGYVFARFSYVERLTVLTAAGVLRIVCFDGRPAVVSDEEMGNLRALSGRPCLATCRFLEKGRRVRVARGALAGMEGVVVKRKSGLRFVISVQAIRQSIAVELDAGELESVA